MCHFPFRYENVTYTSCAHVNITGFNAKGEPWCATEVENDGITVKEYKWALCQDERGLILDGDGNVFLAFMKLISSQFYNKDIINIFDNDIDID